jgi:DNA-binding LacI/PurR family transcriptional regulator
MAKATGRPRPLIDTVAEEIRRRYVDGRAAGVALPPETTLTKEFSVNRRTVRAALSELEGAGRILRKPYGKVLVAKAWGGDWRDHIGRTVGISFQQVGWTGDPSCRRIVQGLTRGMFMTGMKLAFSTHRWHLMDAYHTPATHFGTPDVVGLFHIGRWQPAVRASFLTLAKPAVAIDFDATADKLDSVCFDNHGAGAKLARRAVKLGHKRIAAVMEAGDKSPDRRDEAWRLRHEGLVSALRESGASPPLEIAIRTRDDSEGPTRVLNDLRGKPLADRPTAVVLPWDFLEEVRAVAAARGLKIPRDLTVLGHVEAEEESDLTAIRFDSERLGSEAARHLLRKLRDPKWKERSPVLTEVKGDYTARRTHAKPPRK